MTMELRRAAPADAATVARHRYPGESGDHLAVYATWLPQVMAEGRYLCWLAVQEGRIVGGAVAGDRGSRREPTRIPCVAGW